MEHNSDKDVVSYNAMFLLPNLFTTAALFCGFYAVVAALSGNLDHSAVAIFIAMLLDGMDGRVARMTNTQSDFGAEYDSLSDVICFGVAPALVMYSWSLVNLGKLGWLVAFLHTVCTAIRLARFNVKSSAVMNEFHGLPCPSAAGLLAAIVWSCYDSNILGNATMLPQLIAVVSVMLSFFMVSTLSYPSFKTVKLKGNLPFISATLTAIVVVFVTIDPPLVLLFIFTSYSFSAPILFFLRKLRILKSKETVDNEEASDA